MSVESYLPKNVLTAPHLDLMRRAEDKVLRGKGDMRNYVPDLSVLLGIEELITYIRPRCLPAKRLVVRHKLQDMQYEETIRVDAYIKPEEIKYIRKAKLSNTTEIHLLDGEELIGVRQTLQQFEAELKDYGFYRIHTSFLVNLRHVHALKQRAADEENYSLIFKRSQQELPVSKNRLASLRKALEFSDKHICTP